MTRRARIALRVMLCLTVGMGLLLWAWDCALGNTHCVIYGVVTAPDGAPISGVIVRGTLSRTTWNSLPLPFGAHAARKAVVTTTDNNGRFVLQGHGDNLGIDSFEARGWYLPDVDRWRVELGGNFVRDGRMSLRAGGLASPNGNTPYVYLLYPESDESRRPWLWKHERDREKRPSTTSSAPK